MILISPLLLAAFLVLIGYMVRRRSAVLIAGFFLIFPLVYRAIDITYLDVFGPTFASEINRFVGGNGAAPMFILSALAFILPMLMVFPDRGNGLRRLARENPPWVLYHRYVSHASLALALLLLGALAVNFVLVEAVPILQGMDRLQYNAIAGPVHNVAYELNFLFNFALGAFTVLPRLNGRDYDLRFAGVMVALMTYWVVTGNRYSVFFVLLSFYFMPIAAVVLASKIGRIPPDGPRSFIQRAITSRATRVVSVMAAIVMLVGLVFNSYYNVRSYREPLREIQERILVQPVQLWSTAWERVEFSNIDDPINDYAVREIILNPIDESRNSTIQYLTTVELGYFRSAELVELGQAYNGGYPEVHFELFGAWLPLLTMPLVGLLTALFLRMCILLLYRNMVWSSILGVYLYYGITLHYAGGMVTFFMYPTYWVKIGAFLIALLVESQIMRRVSATRRGPARTPAPKFVPGGAAARPR